MTEAAPLREAVVDLGAVRANVETLRSTIGTPHVMAVVKANAYGHGAAPVARAALAGGADRLGVADIGALELTGQEGVSIPAVVFGLSIPGSIPAAARVDPSALFAIGGTLVSRDVKEEDYSYN